MSEDVYQSMGQSFPALADLLIDINVHSGSFGQDRIGGTVRRFIDENSIEWIKEAIQDIDRASQQLPMSREFFEVMTNYVLETDDEVLALLRSLREGLQEGLATKLAAGSQAKG